MVQSIATTVLQHKILSMSNNFNNTSNMDTNPMYSTIISMIISSIILALSQNFSILGNIFTKISENEVLLINGFTEDINFDPLTFEIS